MTICSTTRTRALALLAVGCLVVTGCTSSEGADPSEASDRSEDARPERTSTSTTITTQPPGEVVFPGAEWDRAEPEDIGLDGEVLDELARTVEASGSNCLVVTRRGKVVGEWYWNGTDASTTQEVFSATKSFASTLVGIAQDRGELQIDEPASTYIDEWAGTPSEDVTIRNLLSNDSGREWSLQLDYGDLIRARDKDRFAIDLGQDHEPGEVWAYNNSAIQTLDAVVHRATGQPTTQFAQEHLLAPIGMAASSMKTDAAGNALMFMGLQSNCEDMARFGYLFLREGRWGDEQVVSSDWVEEATQPSQELSEAYGFLWWLNRKGTTLNPAIATAGPGSNDEEPEVGQLSEGAPESMFWARGLGGQVVAVDPGSETVVVRLGPSGTPEGAEEFEASTLSRVVTDAVLDD